ncbi:HIT family protein [Mobilicoccus pelagius]|uniref:HIT family protein n=1 Tax=Mobilicoccus pelagius NBRC 104925 TaxID=1089455 RepID=H5UUL2_9MICO|nr:HIT family protein [Mobilicoccus pelagius]GAB49420.1 HIT family protein [Mobilicoccus pelagius NBRC 104925]
MTTIFTRIIDGEIPGRFVWQDDTCVAFLTAGPITDGHALVVPRQEIDHWLDADDDLLAHLTAVARRIGTAQQEEWDSARVGLLVQGFEIPHLHVHVWPVNSPEDFDLRRVQQDPDPARMDEAAHRLRERLRSLGHGEHVPTEPQD